LNDSTHASAGVRVEHPRGQTSAAWLIAHLYDASNWYNRNLAIIANIERQFLKASDLRDIQYYFGKHREKSTTLTHLMIQYALALGIAGLSLFYHFALRVLPGIHQPLKNFEFTRSLPYLVVVLAVGFLVSGAWKPVSMSRCHEITPFASYN
jgi:hypothetical protein